MKRKIKGQIHIFPYFAAAVLSLSCLVLSGCADDIKQIYKVEIIEEDETDAEAEDSENAALEESDMEEIEEPTGENRGEPLPDRLEQEDLDTETDDDGDVVMHEGKIVVDLIMFMGQSNMSGEGGNRDLAPEVKEGAGYEFRAISDPTKLYPITEPFGENENFIGGICDLPGLKQGSIVSAFANEYYKETGVPIVAVSASRGASSTEMWLTPGFQFDLKERYDRAVRWLEASNYYIRNRYVVWLQGESDAINNIAGDTYNTNIDDIMRPLFIEGLNRVFFITPGRMKSIKNYFDPIINKQLEMCKTSGYYALGTSVLTAIPTDHMADELHYDQYALNLVGVETAKSCAYLSNNRKERVDYDYENKTVFIPDGNDYTGDETYEPLDLSDITVYTYYMVNETENDDAETVE